MYLIFFFTSLIQDVTVKTLDPPLSATTPCPNQLADGYLGSSAFKMFVLIALKRPPHLTSTTVAC